MINWLFGPRLSPEQQIQSHQRSIGRIIRELDRECARLQQNEKKIIVDIKKCAKGGQMDSVRVMARDLVRTRNQVEKFLRTKIQLQAISLRLQTLKSQDVLSNAMKGVTKAIRKMNEHINLEDMNRIMMEFSKQNEIMDIKEEIIMDNEEELGFENEEAETENVVNLVLDEIGIDISAQLNQADAEKGNTTTNKVDADLQNRLSKLKK